MSINLSNIAILNIKSADYRCIFCWISKNWGHKLNAKYPFDRKEWDFIKLKNLASHIKMGKEILMFGDIEI